MRLIDYYENSGEGLAHYVGVLNEKKSARGFVYGHHWAPHDIRVKELGTGKSRFETAAGLGITFDVVRKLPIDDGTNAVRLLLPGCWFDEETCRVGIEALTFYRKDYNERMQQYSNTQLNRQVALKILPDAFANDPDRLARFTREAQILASLNHPNIAQINGIEEAKGTRALVLELVEGPTLADRIAKGPIPVDEALPISKQIAEALEAAREAG